MPQFGKHFDSVLCIVVVPRNAIVSQECEELLSVFLKSLPAFFGCLRMAIQSLYLAVEPLNIREMLPVTVAEKSLSKKTTSACWPA